ncbi:thioredoxin [Piscinibacter sakaiensis]|uniref:Thioredoxin n=1 Tax=Piscinibacter sakaiensis TaxID=1547922 RepID=A0A0K8P146_PISS1|nr:thioredoxin [Piscinibacter sakaiensis]GAP36348.1 thioredoxin [Piscinibacter sakaiensis]
MSQNLLVTDDVSFQAEIEQRPGVVLVDFWAEWCAPCKALLPILGELADLYAGEVTVAKINADDNKGTRDRLAVRGLPTLILFKDGVEQERLLGMTSKTRLAALLDKYLEA